MHFLISLLTFACVKSTQPSTATETKNTAPSSERVKLCQTTNDLCHDTAWLFWKGYLKPVQESPDEDWEKSYRTGQLSPLWLFGIKNTGIAVNKGKDASWNPIFSYPSDITGSEIAERAFSELCNDGHQKSCVIKGIIIGETNREEAKALFQNACSQENGIGCSHLGLLLSDNPEQAQTVWEQGSKANDSNSTAALAYALLEGTTSEEDTKRAYELLESSCSSAEKPEVFMGGAGFEIQVGRAEHFKGQANACFTLAEKMETSEKANEFFLKSCRMEHVPACEKLCNENAAESCFDLAALYEIGIGVEINPTESTQYFQRSCTLGYQPGCNFNSSSSK